MRELLDQGVDPTDDYVTYGNTAHFDPFDGDAGPDEHVNPWVANRLDTCPYCFATMDWMGCPHCEMSGLYDASDPVCPHCGCFAVWEDCYECGGAGEFDAYEDDPLWYDPGDTETCPECDGRGGWWICMNRDCTRGVKGAS